MGRWGHAVVVSVLLVLSGCGVGVEELDDPSQSEVAASALTCTHDTWSNFGKSFFQARCAGCHGTTFSTAAKVRASGARQAISSGAMPRGTPMTTADRARVEKWFSCGAH